MNESDNIPQVRKSPLWKNYLETKADLLTYGYTIETADLANELGCDDVEGIEFAMAVQSVRKELRKQGMVFTSRGQRGERYMITPPETNQAEMLRMQKAAITAMKQGVILGTSTPLELLGTSERARHEGILEKLAMRAALITRRIPAKKTTALTVAEK